MKRKTMLLAAAALSVLAFGVLPSVAAAEFTTTPTISPVAPATFPLSYSGTGGAGTLFTASGRRISCTGSSASGKFESSMTGTAKVTFTGCTESVLGSKCGSSGTIVTEELTTHTVYLKPANAESPHEKPGVLFTPNAKTGKFAEFTCAGGLVKIVVKGNGVLGTVTAPAIGGTSGSFTIAVEATEAGQKHTETVEGQKFGLESNTNGGTFEPAYEQAGSTTATLAEKAEATTNTE